MLGGSLQQFKSPYFNPMLGTQPRTLKLIYSIISTASSITLNNTNTRYGMVYNAGSPYIGKPLRRVITIIRKTNSPTGTMTITVRDSSDTVLFTSETFDVTLFATTYKQCTVTLPGPIAIPSGGRILVEYTGGDATNSISIGRTGAQALDSNSQNSTFAASYTDSATRTTSFILYQ